MTLPGDGPTGPIAGDDGATGFSDVDDWLLRDEATREFVGSAAGAVASLVRSTLGPRGCETLVETVDSHDDPEVVLTADAGEILDALERASGFAHPVAALLIDAVDSHRRALGDGTTTALLLSGALVEAGLDLVDEGLHPMSVVVGYGLANARAGETLDDLAREVDPGSAADLRDVAATAMADARDEAWRAESASAVAEVVAGLARATDREWVATDDVGVVGSTAVETGVVDGVVVRREPATYHEMPEFTTRSFGQRPAIPEPIEDATVVVVDDEIDFEETASTFERGTGGRVALGSREAAEKYATQLDARRAGAARRLRDLGVDVLVVQERVEDPVQRAFEREDVAVVDRAKYPYEDADRLADATGAQVASFVDDISADHLGTAGRVRDRLVDGEKWATFEGCGDGVSTVVVGARTRSALDWRERLVEDALDVTAVAASDRQVLPGAGAHAAAVAGDVREYARSVGRREQLAVEAFADALETVPRTLAANAGHDPATVVAALRAARRGDGPAAPGVDPAGPEPLDAWAAGVVEPRRVFSQAVETAVGVTEQLLALDTVLFPEVDLDSFDPMVEHE